LSHGLTRRLLLAQLARSTTPHTGATAPKKSAQLLRLWKTPNQRKSFGIANDYERMARLADERMKHKTKSS